MYKVIVLYDFVSEEEGELSVKKNNILDVIEDYGDWVKVQNKNGKSGLVPITYIAGPVEDGTKIVCRGKLKASHKASSHVELSLNINDQVAILDKDDDYWWYVGYNGKTGYVPGNIVKLFKKPSSDDGKYKVKSSTPKKAHCLEKTTILMAFEKELPANGTFMAIFKGEHCEKVVETEKINGFTLRFESPEYYPAEHCKISISHQERGLSPEIISKNISFEFESNLDQLEKILEKENDPFSFLCSSLKVEHGDNDTVDDILAKNFEKQIPEGFEVLKNRDSTSGTHSKNLPTLLHFAAFYNLKRLAKAVLKCPGAAEALEERNGQNMKPVEIAKSKKNDELASILENHQEEFGEDDYIPIYEKMEQIYERYTSMEEKYMPMNNTKEELVYEDMSGSKQDDSHYAQPRSEGEDTFEDYSDVNNDQYLKPFNGLSEKEVQLALLQKRVKERYITQQQALEMVKLLRLEPTATTTPPPVADRSKMKNPASHLSELQNVLSAKSASLPRTSSTSSGSSMSSVSSTGSTGSAGYLSRSSWINNNPPPPVPRHHAVSRQPSNEGVKPLRAPTGARKAPQPAPRRGR